MRSATPLISVVLPVFNGEAFLAESIGSVLSQTYRQLELVVIDDGSTDGSPEVIRTFADADPRVRPLAVPRGGAQRARNVGVAAARGDLVAHIDQDNIAATNKFELQLAWMQRRQLDICGTCAWVFGDADYLRWVPEQHQDILHEFLFTTAMIHSTTMMTTVIAASHPFDEGATYGGYELLTRLGLKYRLGNVPAVLLKYRVHAGQRTRVFGDAVYADRLRFRERLFSALFPAASPLDFRAVMRVADRQPFETDAEARLAERWGSRFAASAAGPASARRMRERWAAATTRLA